MIIIESDFLQELATIKPIKSKTQALILIDRIKSGLNDQNAFYAFDLILAKIRLVNRKKWFVKVYLTTLKDIGLNVDQKAYFQKHNYLEQLEIEIMLIVKPQKIRKSKTTVKHKKNNSFKEVLKTLSTNSNKYKNAFEYGSCGNYYKLINVLPRS